MLGMSGSAAGSLKCQDRPSEGGNSERGTCASETDDQKGENKGRDEGRVGRSEKVQQGEKQCKMSTMLLSDSKSG